jgi:hypothetical protein
MHHEASTSHRLFDYGPVSACYVNSSTDALRVALTRRYVKEKRDVPVYDSDISQLITQVEASSSSYSIIPNHPRSAPETPHLHPRMISLLISSLPGLKLHDSDDLASHSPFPGAFA